MGLGAVGVGRLLPHGSGDGATVGSNPIGRGECNPLASRGTGELHIPRSAQWMKLYICELSPLPLNLMLLGFPHTGSKSLTVNTGETRDLVTAEESEELWLLQETHPGGASPEKQWFCTEALKYLLFRQHFTLSACCITPCQSVLELY